MVIPRFWGSHRVLHVPLVHLSPLQQETRVTSKRLLGTPWETENPDAIRKPRQSHVSLHSKQARGDHTVPGSGSAGGCKAGVDPRRCHGPWPGVGSPGAAVFGSGVTDGSGGAVQSSQAHPGPLLARAVNVGYKQRNCCWWLSVCAGIWLPPQHPAGNSHVQQIISGFGNIINMSGQAPSCQGYFYNRIASQTVWAHLGDRYSSSKGRLLVGAYSR